MFHMNSSFQAFSPPPHHGGYLLRSLKVSWYEKSHSWKFLKLGRSEIHPEQRARWMIALPGQEMNSSFWRKQQISRPRKSMKGLIWDVSRTIRTDPKHICLKLHKKVAENIPSTLRGFFHERLNCFQNQTALSQIQKSFRIGKTNCSW